MKKDKKNIKVIIYSVPVLLIMMAMIVTPCFGTSPKKVAVIPFQMNSKDDLSFLQNGLFSMLSTRLTDPGKVVVLDRETIDTALAEAAKHAPAKGGLNVSRARILGANLGVDYVLFGSMTQFGSSFSIDGSMVDVTGEKPVISFAEQSNSLGDAIPFVNAFARDINQQVFNRGAGKKARVQPDTPEQPKAFQETEPGEDYSQNGSPFIKAKGAGSKKFRKRFRISDKLNCIAADDVDNDGRVEVITAIDHEIKILEHKGNRLVLKKKIEFSPSIRIIALDTADINQNGVPEIFVTALSIHRKNINSIIVEYNKGAKGYKTISKDMPYYFRVIKENNHDKVLFAQKKGGSPFKGKIYKMQWVNSRYRLDKKIKMPRSASVLALARGAIGDNHALKYVLINESGRLNIVDDTGHTEWKSREKTGGSKHYFILPDSELGGNNENRIYLQPRVMVYDNKNDGKNEVLVIHNIELSSVLGRYKKFVKGTIEMHAWNGIALFPVSKTRTVQGWISDFAIADTDNDGITELLVSVVESEKSSVITGRLRSYIISYDL